MYLTTGLWSELAVEEARNHVAPENIIEVTNTKDSNYTKLTDPSTWNIDNEASYLHVCVNETVHGFEIREENFPWHVFPQDMVVVGDMSSNIGTFKINWQRYDVIYAGVQKNLGPAGANLVICRKDLIGKGEKDCPILNNWDVFEKSPGQYYNTPPVWCIFVCGLNVCYMNQRGGVDHYDRMAEAKSRLLYDLIDKSEGYYVNKTDPNLRSRMNITLRIDKDHKLEKKMIQEAAKNQIINISGHPANPGLRISVYNATPFEAVAILCQFMDEFRMANPIQNVIAQDYFDAMV